MSQHPAPGPPVASGNGTRPASSDDGPLFRDIDEAELILRPRRPVAVALAAAILVVGGVVIGLLVALAALATDLVPTGELIVITALVAGLVATGALVWTGRAWTIGVAVATILAALYGVWASLFAVLYVLSALALFLNRQWFGDMRAWREARRRGAA